MSHTIGASELIITPSGAIYHVNLRPEELADTVITVGDPDRVPAVSKYFDRVEVIRQHREFVTHTGYIGHKRLSVVSTGIGPDNIDIVLNELDALANIDFETRQVKPELRKLTIVRLGTSGSLQEDIPVDSFVVSDGAIGLDNLLHYYANPMNPHNSLLNSFSRHTDLADTAIVPYAAMAPTALSQAFAEGYHHGITITCPGFYGPQGRVLRGALAFPQLIDRLSTFRFDDLRITNFEMETSAIYGLGHLFGHDCLSISTIVANRIAKTFSSDAGKYVDLMIRKSLEIISKL